MSQAKHRVYRTGDEPVAGYQLQQFLGRGGFGEVWKVNGPGGVPAAMKIIHDLDRKHGGKELKALRLLRDIRHPNLVPLTAFWLKSDDGETMSSDSLWEIDPANSVRGDSRGTMQLPAQSESSTAVLTSSLPAELVIAMGLAEKSLYDRLRECTDEGWTGVPQEELLTYLEDAARAIDLLNIKHDIQHCDIKPQNILLLGGAAQVCDFGLAKMIGEVRETSMGAGTIAYGAPEILLGKGPIATTDQYSLAVSYVELRTGQLPFASERISDVLYAKQHGAVDLSQLSPAERDVIARAAANDPSQRFDTCCDMMRALRACSSVGGLPPIRSGRTRALVETDRGRTTTSERMVAVAPQRGWRLAAAGIVAVGAVLGSAAWIWSLRAASQSADRSTNETLVAAEHALAAAAAALDRANQNSREHEPTAPICEAAAPVESAAEKEPRGELEAPPSATTTTVNQPAVTPANQPLPAQTEADAAKNSNPTVMVPPAVVPPTAVPPLDKSLEEALNQVAAATATSAANSQTIATATQQTAAATQEIVSTTKEIVLSLDQLREKLTQASNQGGIIEHPQNPSDFYHNARCWEERGDYPQARQAYARLLEFELNVVDPHLRLVHLLRIQEGRSGARETLLALAKTVDNLAMQFALLLVEPDESRAKQLAAFVDQHPDFAPAIYELSREFSKEHLGAQGIADMSQEKLLLKRFLALVEAGCLLPHFFDHREAAHLVDDARRRLAALQHFDAKTLASPVRFSAQLTNDSWIVSLLIAEAAKEIWCRVGEAGEFESTGFQDFVEQRTGSPSPKSFLSLPLDTTNTSLFVKYTDIRGHERGPYELTFDAEQQRQTHGKQILEGFPHSWVSIQDFDGRRLAHVSHALSYRYALREIRYSIDTQDLSETFPLPAWSPTRPQETPVDAKTFIELPAGAKYVAVQLTYQDGTQSKPQRFNVPQ